MANWTFVCDIFLGGVNHEKEWKWQIDFFSFDNSRGEEKWDNFNNIAEI